MMFGKLHKSSRKSQDVQEPHSYPSPPLEPVACIDEPLGNMIAIPAELSAPRPGVAPRVAWLSARFGGVPLPLDPSDFVECMAAIRTQFEFHMSKEAANHLIEFGVKLHSASIEQAPRHGHSDIHPAIAVPLELILFSKITAFPTVLASQGKYGGIPVPVEAVDFEACSNLVACILRWGGKPTKTAAEEFWAELINATEYPRLAGIAVPPPKPRPLSLTSTSSARTAVSA